MEGTEKDLSGVEQSAYTPPTPETGEVETTWRTRWSYLKHYLTSREGWVGDYDYLYLLTPNIWPLNRKYCDYEAPFYGLNDQVPILLTIILGFQHALSMVGSIVSPPLAIAGGAFYFDTELTEYLVSASFIVTGIATALQVTRVHIKGTPFHIGTGLLSVVGPTFDILAITGNYSALRYAKGTCPTASDGTSLPCPAAWGAVLGSMLCTVWIQILMSLVPPKALNKLFPKMVTGSLLLLVGVYLIGNGLQNWGGSSNCHDGSGYYKLCPNIDAPRPLPW
jgi:xanthine/uracil permease